MEGENINILYLSSESWLVEGSLGSQSPVRLCCPSLVPSFRTSCYNDICDGGAKVTRAVLGITRMPCFLAQEPHWPWPPQATALPPARNLGAEAAMGTKKSGKGARSSNSRKWMPTAAHLPRLLLASSKLRAPSGLSVLGQCITHPSPGK